MKGKSEERKEEKKEGSRKDAFLDRKTFGQKFHRSSSGIYMYKSNTVSDKKQN